MKYILMLVGSMIFADVAYAGYVDGQQLNEFCNPRVTNDCISYTIGVIDNTQKISEVLNAKATFCIPINISATQAGAIVAKYTVAHPEVWHLSGSSLVGQALSEAFPCN